MVIRTVKGWPNTMTHIYSFVCARKGFSVMSVFCEKLPSDSLAVKPANQSLLIGIFGTYYDNSLSFSCVTWDAWVFEKGMRNKNKKEGNY